VLNALKINESGAIQPCQTPVKNPATRVDDSLPPGKQADNESNTNIEINPIIHFLFI
jgi:hypothetical protein